VICPDCVLIRAGMLRRGPTLRPTEPDINAQGGVGEEKNVDRGKR